MVYDAVDRTSDAERRERMDGLGSTSTYSLIKEWGVNPKAYAFSGGEVGRLGQHVPERYLDDRQSLKGTRLKLLSGLTACQSWRGSAGSVSLPGQRRIVCASPVTPGEWKMWTISSWSAPLMR